MVKKDTKFKPGVSGNPEGGRKHDPELKAIKNMTKKELVDIGNLVVKGNVTALKAIANDPKATVMRVMLASVAVKIISKGDMSALDVLLNRLIGKVKDEILQQHEINAPRIVLTLPDNGYSAKPDKPEDDGFGF